VLEKGTVFSAVTSQHSDYDSRDPTLLVLREDDFVDVSAGYRHQLDPHWRVSPTVRYNQNDANVATSNYDRFEVMLTVRNDFQEQAMAIRHSLIAALLGAGLLADPSFAAAPAAKVV
jgi:hypothetical protein